MTNVLIDRENCGAACQYIRSHDEIIIDVETTGLNPYGGSRTIGIAVQAGDHAVYFPLRHVPDDMYLGEDETPEGVNLDKQYWSDIFETLGTRKVWTGHNLKFDLHFLTRDGIEPPSEVRDTMLAAHLSNENERSFKLEDLAGKYVDDDAGTEEDALMQLIYALPGVRKTKDAKKWMYRLHPKDVAPYAMADVVSTRKLHDFYTKELTHQSEVYLSKSDTNLVTMWKEINHYMWIIFQMERRGLLLDIPRVRKLAAEAQEHMKRLQQEIDERAVAQGWTSGSVNLNSAPQVQRLLGVASSRREILEEMTDNVLATKILDYRGWAKMLGSYYGPYLERRDDNDVLHPNLNITGTISGRLSSSNPNLQAVPRMAKEEDESAKVKDVFVARPGYKLVECDYSQAEMRLVSWYSQELNMIKLLYSGENMHSVTAERLGIPRDYAKRINFGVVYGLGVPGLSRQLRIPEREAAEYLGDYRGLYPNFKRLYYKCQNVAEDNGYIKMWTGRLRHYSAGIPTHKAMSNLIQGGVAEIMRVAITRIYDEVCAKRDDVHMLLQVHDSILFEIKEESVHVAGRQIVRIMEDMTFMTKTVPHPQPAGESRGKPYGEHDRIMWGVPLLTEAEYGDRWSNLREPESEWRDGVPTAGKVV